MAQRVWILAKGSDPREAHKRMSLSKRFNLGIAATFPPLSVSTSDELPEATVGSESSKGNTKARGNDETQSMGK